MYLTLDDHFTNLTTRAQVRHALLEKVGNVNGGMEADILKITTDAVAGFLFAVR